MAIYFIAFGLTAFLAANSEIYRTKQKILFHGSFIALTIVIGFRHEVGGDWGNYLHIFDLIADQDIAAALITTDPAYGLLNLTSAYFGFSIYFVNFICASIFTYGLYCLCTEQTRPWLALCVAIPYIITAVAMGYTRQSAALGFSFLAILATQDQKNIKFILLVISATLFHKSAVICLIFAAAQFDLWNFTKKYILPLIASVIFLSTHFEHITTLYLSNEVESDGGMIRLAMNFIPACLFIKFRKKWAVKWPKNYDITFILALFSFVLLPIGLVFSTLADRLALYFTAIQIIVYSRLPLLLPTSLRGGMMVAIIMMYLTIFTVWLLWSPWAQCCWIPYKIYIPL